MSTDCVEHARIHHLSPQLANQIAAGEVVERPGSVLKELLENSLDASASRLRIELIQGGKQLIQVTDNGTGIVAEDLPLALSRHATSKISQLSDLNGITSLGFRGEALASIASVSHLCLQSRTKDSDLGWQIRLSGRDNLNPCKEPVGHPQGTSVIVRDLFYNTPARRKFLRTDKTELSHCDEVIRRIALSHMHVAIECVHNQRPLLQLPVAKTERERANRIKKIFGQAFFQCARTLQAKASGLCLSGWISDKDFSRGQTDCQYCYINGRIVRDKLITHAVRQVYDQYLPTGRHPVFCLTLAIASDKVDVNVHPTKHEVRFSEARLVHDFIVGALLDCLNESTQQETSAPALTQAAAQQPMATFTQFSQLAETGEKRALASVWRSQHTSAPHAWGTILQRFDHCLIMQDEQCAWLIDLKRAYRLLCQHNFHQAYHNKPLKSQPLLVPQTQELTDGEAAAIVQNPLFEALGITLGVLGERTIALRGLPARLHYADKNNVLTCILAHSQSLPGKREAFIEALCDQAINIDWRQLSQNLLEQILVDLSLWRADHPEEKGAAWMRLNAHVLETLFA